MSLVNIPEIKRSVIEFREKFWKTLYIVRKLLKAGLKHLNLSVKHNRSIYFHWID